MPSTFMLALRLTFFVMLVIVNCAGAQDVPLRMVLNADAPGPLINRHIYGHFAEHLGNDIYGGLWVEGEDGVWRLNEGVVDALRELNPPNIRWPGGCFADYYHWKDGIGPEVDRPSVVNAMWGGVTENNSFGTHEFMSLVEALGADPIVVGNVGSGTIAEMANWWEYLNHPGPSPMADLRARNGHPEPYGVRFWGVGNESWGCGGNMTPQNYSDVYKRFATYLHGYGGNQPFRIATGPDATMPANLSEWTETVMREAGHMIDGLDMHYYTVVGGWSGRTRATEFTEAQWLEAFNVARRVEEYIRRVSAIMDRYDPDNRVWLIVGEWGMWHQVEPGTNPGFLHQQNALRDALVASVTLDIFAKHAERIRMANIAQTVNVLQAMILTDGERLVRTPTFHVFEMYKVHQEARALPLVLDHGSYEHGGQTIPALSASASQDEAGRVHVSMTNIDPARPRTVDASIRGGTFSGVSGRILTAGAMNAHNTYDAPDAVVPAPFNDAHLDGDTLRVILPPKSVVVLRLE